MTKSARKKLIEVAIPLEAINNESSKRKQKAPKGYPTALHKYWAQRPIAACRAILFAQNVDDPSAWPDRFPTPASQDEERKRLHRVMERMLVWEASNDEAIMTEARWEIARSIAWARGEAPPSVGDPKAVLNYVREYGAPIVDPFSGGGSIPLEAQRLGFRVRGSDLNPVAVLIGKALVEIPALFGGLTPVNPRARSLASNGELRGWRGAQGLAEDVQYYGEWLQSEFQQRVGQYYPEVSLPGGRTGKVVA